MSTKPVAGKYAQALFAWGLLLLPIAYFADCVLDAVLFGEGDLWQQIIAPDSQELAVRILFVIFILGLLLVATYLLTKTARFEAVLRQRNEDLMLANQELEEFSFTLSYDLRNMLTRMYASVGFLKEQCENLENEKIRFLIDNIAVSSDKMEAQIEALLNLAMIASGDLNRVDIQLDLLARDITANLVETQVNGRISWKIQPKIYAKCDTKLIRLALKSLFSNALKFIPGDRRGLIEFGKFERQGEVVYFVRDNGIGFDEDRAKKIFENFRQPDQVSDLPGSGIGLATVRRVIQRHGGRVWAEGVPNAGATFYFTLQSKE